MPITDPNESLIKLRIRLKDGNINTWYSLLKYDKKGPAHSMYKLKHNLLFTKYNGRYTEAIFFDNLTGKPIEAWIEGSEVPLESITWLNSQGHRSQIRLYMIFRNNESKTLYSLKDYEQENIQDTLQVMRTRFLFGYYKGLYRQAVFFEMNTGNAIEAWETDIRVPVSKISWLSSNNQTR